MVKQTHYVYRECEGDQFIFAYRIADKSLKLSASMIMMIQYFIAVIIASTILITTGPSGGQSVFGQIFG